VETTTKNGKTGKLKNTAFMSKSEYFWQLQASHRKTVSNDLLYAFVFAESFMTEGRMPRTAVDKLHMK